MALSALLQSEEVEILSARSGPEALELLLVHDFALAFLDVQMPDMDGFELAELMRGSERTRHVPIIFVTAGAREQQRLFKGYESGAVDFIYKPIEPHILKNKADVFFQLIGSGQQLAQELKERTETLRLNEMFSALLAHDLRNPLSAISGLGAAAPAPHSRSASAGGAAAHPLERQAHGPVDRGHARPGPCAARRRASWSSASRRTSRRWSERVVREHQAAAGPGRIIKTGYEGDCRGRVGRGAHRPGGLQSDRQCVEAWRRQASHRECMWTAPGVGPR